jgi:hypothetical protein
MANGYGGGSGPTNLPTPSSQTQAQSLQPNTSAAPNTQAQTYSSPSPSLTPSASPLAAVQSTAVVSDMSTVQGQSLLQEKLQPTPASAPTTSPPINITQVGNFNIYEDDGDSIMGALLPNVYIRKVTLEDVNDTGGLVDREPHIKVDSLTNAAGETVSDVVSPIENILGDPFDTGQKYTKVHIDLLFKEKVENDDVSLFTIDKIINALKLKIVLSTSQATTDKITQAGSGDPTAYIPQEAGKFLANDKNIQSLGIAMGNQTGTLSLKDIAQFNGLFEAASASSSVGFSAAEKSKKISQKFLLNLDKEVLSDGSIVYNIPYTFTTAVSHSSKELQHLSVFALTYIDFDTLLDGQTEAEFANSKKKQFSEIGYGASVYLYDSKLTGAFQDFKNLINDFGYGIPARNDVIINGKVNNTNTKLVFRGIEAKFANKKDLVWNGPVHYHGSNNPAPDGYQGYMGGTIEHMSDPTKLSPKLKQVSADSIGEILDLRKQKQLEQFFFNYGDFGTGTSFAELTSPVSPALQKSGTEALYEKQTKSNDWKKGKNAPVVSKPVFALHENGEASFHFSLDIAKLISYNTAFPGLVAVVQSNAQSLELISAVDGAKIKKLEVFRKEVSNLKNDKGVNYEGDINQYPISLVTSSDNESGILKTSSNTQQTISGFYGDSPVKLGQKEIAKIEELRLVNMIFPDSEQFGFSDNIFGIRHFTVRDKSVDREKSEKKVFQYGINLEIEDPLFNYIKKKLSIVKNVANELQEYFNFCNSNSKYSNSYTNMFSIAFSNAWTASSYNTSPSGTQSFDKSELFGKVKNDFLSKVVFELKVLSIQEQIDIFVLMAAYLNPYTGSLSGVDSVLKFVLLVQHSLEKLIESVSSTHSIKSTTYGENTLGEKLSSKGGKEPRNIIKTSLLLKDVFDSNSDGSKGYEYITSPELNINQSPSAGGFKAITRQSMLNRVTFENEKYGIGESFVNFGSVDPKSAATTFLGPLNIKTVKGKNVLDKTQINITAQDTKLVNAVIQILESNKEDSLYLDKKDIYETTSLDKTPVTILDTIAIESSKIKVPNMLNILSSDGVSIENYNTTPLVKNTLENPTLGLSVQSPGSSATVSSPNVEAQTITPPIDISSAIEKSNQYKKSVENAFGPSSTPDVSQLLYTLLLMRKADYLPNLTLDSVIGQLLLFAFQGPTGQGGLRPNQIVKLFDLVLDNIPQAELSNPSSVSEYKKKFDNYANLANLVVNYTTLVKLEYFAGYNTINGPNGPSYNLNDPVFKTLDNQSFQSLSNELQTLDRRVLIRIRPYDDAAFFKISENFKMPIFNEYFLLRP